MLKRIAHQNKGGRMTLSIFKFRPLGLKLSAMPQDKPEEEGTYFYFLKIKCLDKVENHLRVLMLEIKKAHKNLQLRSLKSSDNGNPAHSYVLAQVLAYGKSDEIEPVLTAVRA
jgi:putative Mg2+ transporter-C (MgtC) family protein